jgi:hypothetical protein
MGVSTVPSTGARASVHIGEELNYGMVVQPTHNIEFTSESVSQTENPLTSAAIRPDRGRGKQVKGALDIGGDINFELSTSGVGMILRHALGDYITTEAIDGGIHARQARAAAVALTAIDTYPASQAVVLTEDTVAAYTTGKVAIVYRDANGALNVSTNTGAGFAYSGFNNRLVSRVTAVADPDTTHSGGVTDAVAITLAPINAPDGSLVNPVLNPNGGVLLYGNDRTETTYFESADLGPGLGTIVWLNPADTASLSADTPVIGDTVITLPCLTFVGTTGAMELGVGYWVYEYETDPVAQVSSVTVTGNTDGNFTVTINGVNFTHTAATDTIEEIRDALIVLINAGAEPVTAAPVSTDEITLTADVAGDAFTLSTASGTPGEIEDALVTANVAEADYEGVFTHHIERGARLPTGLTVEVDRDASIFLYSGMKVNSLAVNFESQAFVAGTASLLGKAEFAMTLLVKDVVPGAAVVVIEDDTAFPAAGFFTIGEETGLEYTSKTQNLDGTTNLIMASSDPLDVNAIQRIHLKNENVDPRTSNAVDPPVKGINTPLTVFEAAVYIDGSFEEVLSGSITLNNNLNPDKFMLGSRGRAQLVEQRAEVDANLSLEFDDGKNYIKFREGIHFALEVRCVSEEEDSEIGTSGVLSQAYFYLPRCRYTGTTPNVADDNYITHDMPIIATPDDLYATTDYVIILVNGLEDDVSIQP